MFFDPLYLVFALPGLVLALFASFYTKSMFNKYSRIAASTGLTGAQAAERLLRDAGIYDVRIEPISGFLSDHYDPSTKVLRLSPDVFGGRSLSAIGVACHEAGHALQHAEKYGPLGLRSTLVPVVNFTSPLSYIVFVIGLFLHSPALTMIGILFFSAAVVFSLVTLPVEYNASKRAKLRMVSSGVVSGAEARQAGDVLNAAFLTYVAAAVSSLLTLLYLIARSRR